MHSKKEKYKKYLLNILVSAFAILLVLGVAEGTFRLYDIFLGEKGQARQKERIEKAMSQFEDIIRKKRYTDADFNIYYFGASTMLGEPYAHELSIPKLVSRMLGGKIEDKNIRFVNMAVEASDISFNVALIEEILSKKDSFHPSLCVIYNGHNEFLTYHSAWGAEQSRVLNNGLLRFIKKHLLLGGKIIDAVLSKTSAYRLEVDERRLFDEALFGQKRYRQVVAKYKAEIAKAVKVLRKNRVPCIFLTVAGNYAGFEPNRSVFYGSAADRREFERLMVRADALKARDDFDEAVIFYEKASSIYDGFAELHYRLGQCYQEIGQYQKAWSEYQKALNNDMMPIRASSGLNDTIRALRTDDIVRTADAVEYLRNNTETGVIGSELMIDGHHPNIAGYLLLSRLIAEKIRHIMNDAGEVHIVGEDQARREFDIDERKMFKVMTTRGRWFARLATWRYDPSSRLARAGDLFRRAMDIDPSRCEPYLGLAMCSFLQKDTQRGYSYLTKARAINAAKTRMYLGHDWVRQIIERASKVYP